MFKNYIKTALRNIRRNKLYSVLNIAGLALGVTCSLLILLYVQDELSYDKFHTKSDRIFRVCTIIDLKDRHMNFASTAHVQGPMLKDEFPEYFQESTNEVFLRKHVQNYKKNEKNGNYYYKNQNYLKAEQKFKKELNEDPNNVHSLNNLGITWINRKNLTKQKEFLIEFLK